MANTNADILRVVTTDALLDSTIREKQLGAASDNYELAFKFPGGTVKRYAPSAQVGWSAETSKVYLTTSTDDVGIGTAFPGAKLEVTEVDDATTTVAGVLKMTHQTNNTAAAGFGAGFVLDLEDDAGNVDTAATIDVVWSDPTSTTEQSYILFKTLNNADDGLAERARITHTGWLGLGGDPSAPIHLVYEAQSDSNVAELVRLQAEYGVGTSSGFGGGVTMYLDDDSGDPVLAGQLEWAWYEPSVLDPQSECSLYTYGNAGETLAGKWDQYGNSYHYGWMQIAQVSAPGITTNRLYNVSGSLYWDGTDLTAATAAGSNTEIQYNNSGVLGASANFTWDDNTLKVQSASTYQLELGDGVDDYVRIYMPASTGNGPHFIGTGAHYTFETSSAGLDVSFISASNTCLLNFSTGTYASYTNRWALGYDAVEGGFALYDMSTSSSTIFATSSEFVGIGDVYDPDTQLEVRSTSAQLKLSYDGSNDATFTVDSSGNVLFEATGEIRLGAASNYSEFESDGTIVFNGDATVWKDENFEIPLIDPGLFSNALPFAAYNGGNDCAYFEGSGGGTDEYTTWREYQHDGKVGSDIQCHAHVAFDTTTTGDAVLYIDYQIRSGTSESTGTVQATVTGTGTAWEEQRIDIGSTIGGGSLSIGDQISLRIYRVSGGTGETTTDDLYCTTFGYHYELDTCGSRQITTK